MTYGGTSNFPFLSSPRLPRRRKSAALLCRDYEYLNRSRREVNGIDDFEEWNTLKVCPTLFSIPLSLLTIAQIARPLSTRGLLHLRTTRPLPHRRRHPPPQHHHHRLHPLCCALLSDPSQSERVCHPLSIPPPNSPAPSSALASSPAANSASLRRTPHPVKNAIREIVRQSRGFS